MYLGPMPHILDLIIALPLVWAAYKGFKKGFIFEIVTLIALVAGILGAVRFSDVTASYMQEHWAIDERYLPILAFVITFILVVMGVHLLGRALDKVMKMAALGTINKLAGALFRLAKVALIISVIFNTVNSLDEDWGIVPPEMKEDSVLYQPLSELAPIIVPAIRDHAWIRSLQEALPGKEDIPGIPQD